MEELEWTDWPATMIDVSEAQAKPHDIVVNKWNFMAVLVDFRVLQPEAGEAQQDPRSQGEWEQREAEFEQEQAAQRQEVVEEPRQGAKRKLSEKGSGVWV